MGIIELQGLDGPWPIVEPSKAIAGVESVAFGELEDALRSRAMATILALAVLRKRWSPRRATWQMITDGVFVTMGVCEGWWRMNSDSNRRRS
jgi:hypothetical protein